MLIMIVTYVKYQGKQNEIYFEFLFLPSKLHWIVISIKDNL
jgi:hypothetical protein